MKKSRIVLIIACSLFLVYIPADAGDAKDEAENTNRIRPYVENPKYWQYKGEPVLLLGGSKDDNLFQVPDLKEHLDLLASVGGNYIRNTMSARVTRGFEVQAFRRLPDGKYDLNQWNDEYWNRFENLLKWTVQRDIIVQIEVWDRFDYTDHESFKTWESNPYNPANNINYTSAESGLSAKFPEDHPSADKQPFFHTIPAMDDNKVLRGYQEDFIDKMLSCSLPRGNVLYCMNNETSTAPAWGQYWMKYIEGKAAEAGVDVYVTDMFDVGWDLATESKFLTAFDNPGTYTFLDISQNNSNKNTVAKHWKNIRFAHDRTKDAPRPINNVKVYGADEYPPESGYQKRVYRRWGTQSGIRSFMINILGGCASARFHRNQSNGIGLTKPAWNTIKAVRKLESLIKMWEVDPDESSLSGHDAAGVFLAARPGEKYAVYFADGGASVLNLPGDGHGYRIRWINVDTGQWGREGTVPGGDRVTVSAPGTGGWIAAIVR